jgi:hypothetical protein
MNPLYFRTPLFCLKFFQYFNPVARTVEFVITKKPPFIKPLAYLAGPLYKIEIKCFI